MPWVRVALRAVSATAKGTAVVKLSSSNLRSLPARISISPVEEPEEISIPPAVETSSKALAAPWLEVKLNWPKVSMFKPEVPEVERVTPPEPNWKL